MKKVLLFTPNFPPVAYPDMHRVRISLPFMSSFGWEPLVLKIDPLEQEGSKEFLLEKSVPTNIKTWQAGSLPKNLTKWFGINSVGLRSFFHLAALGSEIIEKHRPDLIFFSTTMFPLMVLGRFWWDKYEIPYVIDFQDLWLSDYYKERNSRPPGGYLKYGISHSCAKYLEAFTLRKVSHIISVSPKYSKILRQRYAWLKEENFTELPFGAAEADFELLSSLNIRQHIFDPDDGLSHWVYVGRGGNDMSTALSILFGSIQKQRERSPERWNSIRLHFIGTSYASSSQAAKTIEPISVKFGLSDIVEEHTERIPYFEALQVLTDSDAILLVGSDDPSYTASKLYPCILAHKPILAVFHEQSSVVPIIQQCNVGRVVPFSTAIHPEHTLSATEAAIRWLVSLQRKYEQKTRWSAFAPYTAKSMTQKQCKVFDSCIVEKTYD